VIALAQDLKVLAIAEENVLDLQRLSVVQSCLA
jgi:hypothetical protein